MNRTVTKWVSDEEEANKVIGEMETQGYDYYDIKYTMVNNGSDCYDGAVIIFKR